MLIYTSAMPPVDDTPPLCYSACHYDGRRYVDAIRG